MVRRYGAAAAASQVRAGCARKGWCPAATTDNAWRGSGGGFAGSGDQRLGDAMPIVYRAKIGGKWLRGRRAAATACPSATTAAAATATRRRVATAAAPAAAATTTATPARSLSGAAAGAGLWRPLAAIMRPGVGAAS